MKCFLHIGTPKTATKTIQLFLESNREFLKKHGFAYLRGKKDNRTFYRFVMLAYPPSRRDRYTALEQIKTDEGLLNFQRVFFSEMKAELARTLGGKKDLSVVISSEIFQSVLVSQDDLLRLKEVLLGLGLDEIRVVVYLRNPPDFASSMFSTLVKLGSVEEQPIAPENPDAWLYDHRKTLERFSAVFGEEAIIPRIFHRARLKEGCIIRDFCDAVGIPLDEKFVIPGRENESLSNLGVSLLRRINKLVPALVDKGANPLRTGIEGLFDAHFEDAKYRMPKALAERYQAAFKESNEWVRQKFFPELPSLFPDEPLPEEVRVSASEAELDAVARSMGNAWVKYNRCRLENKRLLQVNRQRRRVIRALIVLAVLLSLACLALIFQKQIMEFVG